MAQSPNPQQMYGHYPTQGYAPQYQPTPEYQYSAYSPQPPQQASTTPLSQPTPEPTKDQYGNAPLHQHQSFYGGDHFQQQQQQQQMYGAPAGQPQQMVYMMAQPSGQYPQQAVQQQSQPLLEGGGSGGGKKKKAKVAGAPTKSRALTWLFTLSVIELGLMAVVCVPAFQNKISRVIGIRAIVVGVIALITAILVCVMRAMLRKGRGQKLLHFSYAFLFSVWITAIVLLAITRPWIGVSSYTRRDLHGILEVRKGGKGGGGGGSSGGSSSSSSSSSVDGLPGVARILTLVAIGVAAVMLLLITGSWISKCIRDSKEKKRYTAVGQQAWPMDNHRSVDMSAPPEKPAQTV